MYADVIQKDPKKNNRFIIIVFLICVALIMVAVSTCSGQNCTIREKPYKDYQDITRFVSCQGIRYENNGKDVFINIFADSLNPHSYLIKLYVFFAKGTILNKPSLVVGYDDEDMQELIPIFTDSIGGYVEFIPKENELAKLRDKKANYINFNNNDIDYIVFEDKIDIFYNFIRGL